MQRESGKPTTSPRPTSRHSYTGRGQRAPRREKRFSQASTRRPLISYDQHGRPWFVETEIRSGMPGGPWQPLFQAPWYPQSIYFRVNPDNTAEMYVDYPTMRQEKRIALDGFHGRAVKLATKKGWPIPKRGEKYSEEIVEEIGTAPRAIEPIIAAEQENPWVMGWTRRPDPRLVELVKPKRRMMSVEEEGFDFSEASYEATVGERASRGDLEQTPEQREKLAAAQRHLEAIGSEDVAGVDEDDIEDETRGVTSERRHGASDFAAPLVDVNDEAAEGAFATDEKTERALDLEDELDPEATGGRKVPVQTKPQAARAERRPPAAVRKPGTKPGKPGTPAFKKGDRAKPGTKGERKTLAQGARPVVSDLVDDEE